MSFVAAALGGAATLGAAALASRDNSRALDAQRDAIAASTTELQPFNLIGPGGQFAGIGSASPFNTSNITQNPAFFNFASLLGGAGGAGFSPSAGSVLPGGTGGLVGGRQFLDQFGRPQTDLSSLSATDRLAAQGFRDQSLLQSFNLGGPAQEVFNREGQTIFTGLGDLDPARAGLVGLATQSIGRAGLSGGLPSNVAQANNAFLGNLFSGDLNALQQGAGQAFGASLADFGAARSPFQQGLQDAAFGGAQNLASIAGQDPQAVAQQRLDLLREQARPFEERQFAGLQENLFGTGRLGTSGGALQTEAFARGLAQADLDRQLAASAEGRAFQNQALQGAQGLSGIGTGVRSLQDQLLQSAFGRFQGTAGLAADLTGQRSGLLQQNLQNQIGLAGLGQQLQSGQLGLALQALQAQGGLNTQALANFQAALAASQAQANARIGAGSNIAQIASNPNFGQGSGIGTTLLAGIANNAGSIANLFGGGGSAFNTANNVVTRS